jgi:hypothetical protein
MKKHMFDTDEIRSVPDRSLKLQKLILKAQADAEQAALKTAEWFISDRSAVDPIVYATRYVRPEAAKALIQSPELNEPRT